MRKYLLFIFFILNLTLNAQNWDIIGVNRTYYFGNNIENLTPVYTNNVISFSADTIAYHLNTFMAYCDTCTILDPQEYFIKNQHGFLNKLILKQGTDFLIFNPDSLILKTAEPLNSSWLFDPENGTTAFISQLSEENILGSLDSVKTILVSNGDTIKLSKNYGIIKYQNQGVNYELGGAKVNGFSQGLRPQGYKRFYDFEIGDVFQYEEMSLNGGISSFTNNRTIKVEVVNRTELLNSLTYTIIERVSSNGPLEPQYQENTKTLSYAYDETDLAEKKDLDVINLGIVCGDFNKSLVTGNLDSKEYGNNLLIDYNSDFYKLEPVPLYTKEYLKITKGLGVVKKYIECGEVSYNKELVGYIKNGVQTGEIWEDWKFTEIKQLKNQPTISIFPNPSSDIVFVNFETPEQNLNISILDNLGERLLEQSFSNKKQIQLDVFSFAKGIYFLKLEANEQVYQQKIVIR